MSIIFPASNLATASQPWAREVQKQLSNLITSSNSERINNVARDNQLNSSILALSGVVADVSVVAEQAAQAAEDANDAINGLIGLGSTGSGYTLNADNINGGTITGVTLQTASSGRRVIISGTSASFYDDAGVFTGELTSSGSSGSSTVLLSNIKNGPFGSANAARITLNQTSIVLGVSVSGGFGPGSLTLGGTGVQVSGILTASFAEISGRLDANSTVYMPGLGTASTNIANVRRNQGSDGQVVVTNQSSIRFKKDVVDLTSVEELDPKKLLELPVRAFRYKDNYPIATTDSRYGKLIPGFIAEEVDEFYPIGADHEDGESDTIESWNERILVPPMLALIQELYARIETLEKGA